MTKPVGSRSSVTFTDEVTVASERLPLPALREHLNAYYCGHNIIIYNICYCVHNIIVLLVLIQQHPDNDDSRSNSRADWPELRNYRLKVEIFQLGAKIAPLKTSHPHRVAPNAPPGKISRLSQPHDDGAAVSSRRRGSSAEIVRSFSFCVYF